MPCLLKSFSSETCQQLTCRLLKKVAYIFTKPVPKKKNSFGKLFIICIVNHEIFFCEVRRPTVSIYADLNDTIIYL